VSQPPVSHNNNGALVEVWELEDGPRTLSAHCHCSLLTAHCSEVQSVGVDLGYLALPAGLCLFWGLDVAVPLRNGRELELLRSGSCELVVPVKPKLKPVTLSAKPVLAQSPVAGCSQSQQRQSALIRPHLLRSPAPAKTFQRSSSPSAAIWHPGPST
jgi:hypothetical protein